MIASSRSLLQFAWRPLQHRTSLDASNLPRPGRFITSTAACAHDDANDIGDDAAAQEFKPWSNAKHLHITDSFLGSLANDLRSSFDDR
jgi:hypothetical protein